MSRKSCIGCRHYRSLSGGGEWHKANSKVAKGCHYLLDTGEPRGCPAAHCTRYDPAKESPAELTARKQHAIVSAEEYNQLKIRTPGRIDIPARRT